MALVLFIVGIALLIGGAELLVRGASRLALALGISPLVVGLTIVAFGTSAPELAVTLQSSMAGAPELAVGNVVGSNIANILLILGLAALIAPLTVPQQLIRLDIPLMIGCALLTLVLGLDGMLGRLDGALLFSGIMAYIVFAVVQSRRERIAVQVEYAEAFPPMQRPSMLQHISHAVMIVVGLVLLVLGASWIVSGAVTFARALGLSELIVGLTIVAVGTSLPEIAATLAASFKGERDIAVGNVVGSCVFNLLAVLGLSALVAPAGVPVPAAALQFDFPVMLAASIACLPIVLHERSIARWEGALFLGYYIAYTVYLVLVATENMALSLFNSAMLGFVIPLTVITLLVLWARSLRQARRARNVERPTT
jgi:cation:H+ antiporter